MPIDILESLTTPELDEMLNAELRKETPDGALFRRIIRVLEEREKDHPVEITPKIQAAWEEYMHEDQRRTDRRKPTARNWVMRAGSMAATFAIVCTMLFLLPAEAHAETFWEKLARWTDSVVEFLSPRDAKYEHSNYTFQTDNPGLQEVYDAVVELGVTEPVVPMWLPDGYELKVCKPITTDSKKNITSCFSDGTNDVVISINVHKGNVWHEYHKDEEKMSEYESNSVIHTIIRNLDKQVVLWGEENLECSLSLVCQDDILYRIIDSIYALEGE